MMTVRLPRRFGSMLVMLLAVMPISAGLAAAQAPVAPVKPAAAVPIAPAPALPAVNSDARRVRQELNELFQQVPPSLQQVLQLDPSLLANTSYLAPYPALATYLAQHPEIGHNPAYFVGSRNNYQAFPPTIGESIARMIEPVAVGSVFITLICVLGWIIRGIMNHRRWLRVSKMQTETQNKLLERFTSNEEMLAFIQTSAGQRFLESASLTAEPGPRALSAPVGRMLWSIQLGIVVLVTGAGLELVSRQLANYDDAVTAFRVAGGIVIALGVGFILSALGSFVLSRRLGLLDPAPMASTK